MTSGNAHNAKEKHVTKDSVVKDSAQRDEQCNVITEHAHKQLVATPTVTSDNAYSEHSYNAETTGQRQAQRTSSENATTHLAEDHAHHTIPDHVTTKLAQKEYVTTPPVTSGHAYNGSSYNAENTGHHQAQCTRSNDTVTATHLTEERTRHTRPDHVTPSNTQKECITALPVTSAHASNDSSNDAETIGQDQAQRNRSEYTPTQTNEDHASQTGPDHANTDHAQKEAVTTISVTSGHAHSGSFYNGETTGQHQTQGSISTYTKTNLPEDHAHYTRPNDVTNEQAHREYVSTPPLTSGHANGSTSYNAKTLGHVKKQCNTLDCNRDHLSEDHFRYNRPDHVTADHAQKEHVTTPAFSSANAYGGTSYDAKSCGNDQTQRSTSDYYRTYSTKGHASVSKADHVIVDHSQVEHVTTPRVNSGHAYSGSFHNAESSGQEQTQRSTSDYTKTNLTENHAHHARPDPVNNQHVTAPPLASGHVNTNTYSRHTRPNHVTTGHSQKEQVTTPSVTLGHAYSGSSDEGENTGLGEARSDTSDDKRTYVTEDRAHYTRPHYVTSDHAQKEHVTTPPVSSGNAYSCNLYDAKSSGHDETQRSTSDYYGTYSTKNHAYHSGANYLIDDHAKNEHVTTPSVTSGHAYIGLSDEAENSELGEAQSDTSDDRRTYIIDDNAHYNGSDHLTTDHAQKEHLATLSMSSANAYSGTLYDNKSSGHDQTQRSTSDYCRTYSTKNHAYHNRANHVIADQAQNEHVTAPSVTSGHAYSGSSDEAENSELGEAQSDTSDDKRTYITEHHAHYTRPDHVNNEQAHKEHVSTPPLTSGHANGSTSYNAKTLGHVKKQRSTLDRNRVRLSEDHSHHTRPNNVTTGHAKRAQVTTPLATSGHTYSGSSDEAENSGLVGAQSDISDDRRTYITEDYTPYTRPDYVTPDHSQKEHVTMPPVSSSNAYNCNLYDAKSCGQDQTQRSTSDYYRTYTTKNHAYHSGANYLIDDHAQNEHVTTPSVTSGHAYGGSSDEAENSELGETQSDTSNDRRTYITEHHAHNTRPDHVTADHAQKEQITAPPVSSGNAYSCNLYDAKTSGQDQTQRSTSDYYRTYSTKGHAHHNRADHVIADQAQHEHVTTPSVTSVHAYSGSSDEAEDCGLGEAQSDTSDDRRTYITEDHAHYTRPDHVTPDHAHKEHVTTPAFSSAVAYGGTSYDAKTSGHEQMQRSTSKYYKTYSTKGHASHSRADHVIVDHSQVEHVTTPRVNSGYAYSVSFHNAESSGQEQTQRSTSDYTKTNLTEKHAQHARPDPVNKEQVTAPALAPGHVNTNTYTRDTRSHHVTTDHAKKEHVNTPSVTSGHAYSGSFYEAEFSGQEKAHGNTSTYTKTNLPEDHAHHARPDHLIAEHAQNEHVTAHSVTSGHAYNSLSDEAENSGLGEAQNDTSDIRRTHIIEDHAHCIRPDHVTTDHGKKEHVTTPRVTSGHAYSGSFYNAATSGEDQARSNTFDYTKTNLTEDHAHYARPDRTHKEHVTASPMVSGHVNIDTYIGDTRPDHVTTDHAQKQHVTTPPVTSGHAYVGSSNSAKIPGQDQEHCKTSDYTQAHLTENSAHHTKPVDVTSYHAHKEDVTKTPSTSVSKHVVETSGETVERPDLPAHFVDIRAQVVMQQSCSLLNI